ncbi:hypothetical protein [Kitasatospora sp. NPDC057223]|uniref:hypothetical protein n=1 Tax=Kitasatospora sp. NPDC057223 TaxID=3346055 RepID=UPI00363A4E9E
MMFDRLRSRRKGLAPEQTTLIPLLDRLEAAVAGQDAADFETACQNLQRALGNGHPGELADMGARLTALLPAVPPWPRAYVAVMVGACVEGGADPVACSEPILNGVREALTGALLFAERWEQVGGGKELPQPGSDDAPDDPDRDDPDRAIELLGGQQAPDALRAVTGWWTLHLWELAAVSVLSDTAVRTAAAASGVLAELLRLADDYAGVNHELKCLTYAAKTLHEEELLVLDRPTGTGYLLRMSGLTDNFQLHTLLAHVLVGGGHLKGDAPSAAAVAACRDADIAPEQRPHTVGAFNLVAPDGSWIWNEGTPSDIPVLDGVRTLVLDPAPYRRGWPAGRFIPGIEGELTLVRVLSPQESGAALAKAAEPKR